MIKRPINQEDIIILDVFKGHVSIPDILIGSHRQSHLRSGGVKKFRRGRSSCKAGEASRKHNRYSLQRCLVCLQGYIQRHGTESLMLECSGMSKGYLKQIYTTSLPFCSQACLFLDTCKTRSCQ